jgi:hypothetical protein
VSCKSANDGKMYFVKASRNNVWFIITYFRNLFNNLFFLNGIFSSVNLTRANYPSSCLGFNTAQKLAKWLPDSAVLCFGGWVESYTKYTYTAA